MNRVFWPLAAMTLTQAMVAMALATVPVLAPALAIALGVDGRMVGIYTALAFAGAMASTVIGGALVPRFGPIATSRASLIVTALALALTALGSLPLVLFGAVAAGLGYGLATPAASHVLARRSPDALRGLVFSIKQSAVPVGGLLAGLMVPPIVLVAGWEAAVICVAGLVAAAGLALGPLRASQDDDRQPGLAIAIDAPWQSMRLVLGHPILRRLALTTLVFSSVHGSVMAIMVSALVYQADLTLVAAGAVFSAMQAAGVIARVAFGWVSDRLIAARPLMGLIGVAIFAAAILLANLSPDWSIGGILAAAVFAGICISGWPGVYLAEVARSVPQQTVGAATGGTVFFSFLGTVIGPAGFSLIVAATDRYAPAFAIFGTAALIVATILLVGHARGRGREA
ncbi:MAG: MFS transporter [Alphaproteobacteria bacterium]|jgi:MFS family permease|nr:MFS transporter [Alphaproteobacteria bacterium]MDP6518202.1 MFS transporter [Alphaproteobacteria bacterium]